MIKELLKKGKGDLAARVAVSAVLQGRFFFASFRMPVPALPGLQLN